MAKRKTQQVAPEKVSFPKVAPVLHLGKLKFKLICDMDRYSSGSMLFRIADCEGTVKDEGEKIGSVGASIGATIFVEVGRRTWTLNPMELFEAVREAEKEQYL